MGKQTIDRIMRHEVFVDFSEEEKKDWIYLKVFLNKLSKCVKKKRFGLTDYFSELTIELCYRIDDLNFVSLKEMIDLAKEITYLPEPIKFLG